MKVFWFVLARTSNGSGLSGLSPEPGTLDWKARRQRLPFVSSQRLPFSEFGFVKNVFLTFFRALHLFEKG